MNWINQKQLDGDSVSEGITCEKIRLLYSDLIHKTPGTALNFVTLRSNDVDSKNSRASLAYNVARHDLSIISDKSGANLNIM